VDAVDLTRPFRGSAAMAAGLVTASQVRGPRFRRMFPDVYVSAAAPTDLMCRSLAAAVHVGERGVLVGYSAAELHSGSCADRATNVARTALVTRSPPTAAQRPLHRGSTCR
jgi:hypothetical protein